MGDLSRQGAGGARHQRMGLRRRAGHWVGPALDAFGVVDGGDHSAQGVVDLAGGVGQEVDAATERLVALGVENVEDQTDEKPVGGAVPVIAHSITIRIDQDVGNILRVADLLGAKPDLFERVVAGALALGVGRVESQAARAQLLRPPPRGQGPVLTLDVVDEDRVGPAEQVGQHEPDTLAGAGGCKDENVLGSVVA